MRTQAGSGGKAKHLIRRGKPRLKEKALPISFFSLLEKIKEN
jgi:hypothetical protein